MEEIRMKKRILKIGAVVGISGMLFRTAAFAGASMETYGTVVGRFNGAGATPYQTKTYSERDGYINSVKVGGKYEVDVRMENSSAKGAWLRDVTDGTRKYVQAHSKHIKGCSVRLYFSNDITTPVTVYVEGTWKSN